MNKYLHEHETFRFGWLPIAVYLLAASILAGCGDLSATSMNSSGSITTGSAESGGGTIISGVGVGGTGVVKTGQSVQAAAETGLVDAIVFVDLNNNRQPDPDEPQARTDANGSYRLELGAGRAVTYPVLLQALAGLTRDRITGETVPETYVTDLQAPVETAVK